MPKSAHLLIIDIEATCSKREEVPRDEMEIIEIGAVVVDETGVVLAEFQSFARPVRHPQLTTFCQELTTISQQQVDEADDFPSVMAKFGDWIGDHGGKATFASWGDFDRKQFHRDCEFHQVGYPFGTAHRNLKVEFAKAQGLNRPKGVGGALASLGLRFQGTAHRGLDDARNIARIYAKGIAPRVR